MPTTAEADYSRLIVLSSVYNDLHPTVLSPALHLSRRLGCRVFLKREDQQLGFGPHIRGIYNAISQIPRKDRWRGVVVPSLHHYARATAWAAQLLQTQAVIIAEDMSADELHELQEIGCVVLHRSSPSASCGSLPLASACQLRALHVNPLDDCRVLAGMGTVGLEILQQTRDVQDLEAVFCSARAAGALEAIGMAVKLFAPRVRVIGVGIEAVAASASVSPASASSMSIVDSVVSPAGDSREDARCNSIDELKGLQVQEDWPPLSEQLDASTTSSQTDEEATSEASRIHPSVVDEVMFVAPYDMSQAMKDVFAEIRVVMDADGSLAVAGLKRHAFSKGVGEQTRSLVAVISSANSTCQQLYVPSTVAV